MNDPDKNAVRDMRQAFDLSGAASAAGQLAPVRRVKVFKSGNSLAVRMPKELGLEAGMELELNIGASGTMELRKAAPVKRKFDIDKVAGSAKGLKYIEPETRLFEPRPSASDPAR